MKRLSFSCSHIFVLGYIISIGINQKPEMLVGATSKIGEYLKNCGYQSVFFFLYVCVCVSLSLSFFLSDTLSQHFLVHSNFTPFISGLCVSLNLLVNAFSISLSAILLRFIFFFFMFSFSLSYRNIQQTIDIIMIFCFLCSHLVLSAFLKLVLFFFLISLSMRNERITINGTTNKLI